jgi:hypothetical protein
MPSQYLLSEIHELIALFVTEKHDFNLLSFAEANQVSEKISSVFCTQVRCQFWWEYLKFPFITYDLEQHNYEEVIRILFDENVNVFLILDSHQSNPFVIFSDLTSVIKFLGELSFVEEYAVVNSDYIKMVNVNHDNIAYLTRVNLDLL